MAQSFYSPLMEREDIQPFTVDNGHGKELATKMTFYIQVLPHFCARALASCRVRRLRNTYVTNKETFLFIECLKNADVRYTALNHDTDGGNILTLNVSSSRAI